MDFYDLGNVFDPFEYFDPNSWFGDFSRHPKKHLRKGLGLDRVERLFDSTYSANSLQNTTGRDIYGPTGSIIGKY